VAGARGRMDRGVRRHRLADESGAGRCRQRVAAKDVRPRGQRMIVDSAGRRRSAGDQRLGGAMGRVAIGLAIFLGFGAYGGWNAVRWANWPKAPQDMAIAEAVQHPDVPWVRLTNGDWRCDFAYTEGTFSYFTLTDGHAVVVVGYEDKPQCPPP